jgi:hypothetical protein
MHAVKPRACQAAGADLAAAGSIFSSSIVGRADPRRIFWLKIAMLMIDVRLYAINKDLAFQGASYVLCYNHTAT